MESLNRSTFRISAGVGVGAASGSSIGVRRSGGSPAQHSETVEVRVVDSLAALELQRDLLDRGGFVPVQKANPAEVRRSSLAIELTAGQGAEPSSASPIEVVTLMRSLYIYELRSSSPRHFVCLELPINPADRAFELRAAAP